MPHLRFRALDKSVVAYLSSHTLAPLAALMACPAEDITYEYIQSEFYSKALPSKAYPFIEILWFDRGQAVQDKVASYLTQVIKDKIGCDELAIIFTPLRPSAYYDMGEHYG
jgi:hypothetical protein